MRHLLLCLLLAASFAHAGDTPPTPASQADAEPEALQKKMQRKVSFDFADTPLEEALNFSRSLTRSNLILDSEMLKASSALITLKVADTPIREALEKVLEASKTGAKLYYIDQGYWIGKTPPAADLNVPTNPQLALPADAEPKLRAAIKDLASDDYEIRSRAQARIREYGSAALPTLEGELGKKGDDAERQNQLKSLGLAARADLVRGPLSEAQWEALHKQVTFEFVDTTAEEALNFLNGLARDLKLQPGSLKPNDPITMRVNEMDIGAALRWIARQTNTKLDYSKDGIKFVERVPK